MCQEDRKYVDGCAIFWKRDKYGSFSFMRPFLRSELAKVRSNITAAAAHGRAVDLVAHPCPAVRK